MARRASRGAEIERLIAAEDWIGARRKIQQASRGSAPSHWLLSRLALTYYEQYRYKVALKFERRALALAPHCPMVLWGLAGTFDMLERTAEAESIYRRIIRRGPERLATGRCGEGWRWARGLIADCWYRLAQIRERRGDRANARRAWRKYLSLRRAGASIYAARDARTRMRKLESASTPLKWGRA